MSSLDSLPGDQRAVLQLVLGRGRSYDEIARLLSINPVAVRERALTAFDALGPQTKVSAPHRAMITDYLLGQLPEGDLDEVRDLLAESPGERAWARVISSELTSVAGHPLPEIPIESSSARAASQAPPPVAVAPPSSDSEPDEQPAHERESRRQRRQREKADDAAARAAAPAKPEKAAKPDKAAKAAKADKPAKPAKAAKPKSEGPRRSSRFGGSVVIGAAVVIVIVVLFLVIHGSGGSSPKQPAASKPTTSSTAAPATSTTATTSTTSSAAKVVSQINLTPPAAGSKAAGIAEILSEGATDGIAIVAQNVPPNTTKPPNAYAVWLYNTPTDSHILGFVNPGVASNGRLSTAGGLPANAAHYKQLIVTVETSANPKTPGHIILQGTLTGL
jgi:hypothetical protein